MNILPSKIRICWLWQCQIKMRKISWVLDMCGPTPKNHKHRPVNSGIVEKERPI